MGLAEEDIISFQELYKSEFGMEISKEVALEKVTQLLSLMSAICQPQELLTEDLSENKLTNNIN